MMELEFLSVASILLFVTSVSACPVDVYPECSCKHDFHKQVVYITCQDFEDLDKVPEIGDSYNEKIESFIIKDSEVATIQENAFKNLKIRELTLAKNNIQSVDAEAFSGLNETIEELYLQENDITNLDASVFAGLSLLKYLDLGMNSIQMLDEKLFNGVPNLSYLRLPSNRLRFLPVSIFSELKFLLGLHLERNNIEDLPARIFDNFAYLKDLDLSHNSLYVLNPTLFDSLKVLQNLGLAYNDISALPSELFRKTNQLQRLDLSGNRITMLPDRIFEGCAALQQLKLQNNYIKNLPEGSIEILRELTELHLEYNQLESLPDNIFRNLTDLKLVYLQNNAISTLPDNLFVACNQIQIIDIHDNTITDLQSGLFPDGNFIDEVDLSENEIGHIDSGAFDELIYLRKLNLGSNSISVLPNNIFDNLGKLKELYINDNFLTEITSNDFGRLDDLRHLDLSNNHIEVVGSGTFDHSIPVLEELLLSFNALKQPRREMFLGGEKLLVLELNNNQLESVPSDTFLDLNSLRYLFLQNNRIEDISDTSFTILPNLIHLDLSNNSLQSIPQSAFSTLTRLTSLNLSHNEIKTILPDSFVNLENLLHIDLSYNTITTLEENALTGVSNNLNSLSIAYNPLNCDCSIFWLRSYKAIRGYNITVCMETYSKWKYVVCLTYEGCAGSADPLISPNDTLCQVEVPILITTTTTTSTSTTTTPVSSTVEAIASTRKERDMSMVYIIIGSVLGAFFLVTIIVVLIMVRRKQKANEMEEKLVSDIGSSVVSNSPPDELAGKTFESYKIPTGNHKGAESLRWRSQSSDIDGSNQALPEIGQVQMVNEQTDDLPDIPTRERRFKKKSEQPPSMTRSNSHVNEIEAEAQINFTSSSPELTNTGEISTDVVSREENVEDANDGQDDVDAVVYNLTKDESEDSIEDNTQVAEPVLENVENTIPTEERHPPVLPPIEDAPSPTRKNFMEGKAIPKSRDIGHYYSNFTASKSDENKRNSIVDDVSITQSKGSVMEELGRRLSAVRGNLDERMAKVTEESTQLPVPENLEIPDSHVEPAPPEDSEAPVSEDESPPSPSNSNFTEEAMSTLSRYQERKRRESDATVIEDDKETDSQRMFTLQGEKQNEPLVPGFKSQGSLEDMNPDSESRASSVIQSSELASAF